ncbi:hypothetical protein GQ53DRAFT_729449 [Thozetella sp. PMI_491]|nr:hypothetical protein GQ53DRAFT_729449 [Thozetella sp. PMI_491]
MTEAQLPTRVGLALSPARYLVVVVVMLTTPALAQSTANKTKLSDFFWQLADLESHAPSGNPWLGNQNFTYCCLKAVNYSMTVEQGQLVLLNDWVVLNNASDLINADDRGQFPCGATFNGDPQGAPIVQVDYEWLARECPGWERSSQANLNTWLQPLSGFLLPAVIFCLSIPRRRKIYVYRALFAADIYGYRGLVPSILGGLGAMLLVTLDTIIWLCICFAFSGPMIICGLYEAMLDNRLLEFLRVKIQNQRLTLDMRCRLLMIVLIGNLDLAVDEPREDREQPISERPVSERPVSERPVSATYTASQDITVTYPFENRSGSATIEQEVGQIELIHQPAQGHSTGLAIQNVPSHRLSQDNNITPSIEGLQNEGVPGGALHGISSRESRPPVYPQRDEDVGNYRAVRVSTAHLRASPWRHMEQLLYPIRLYDDDNAARDLSPRQWPKCVDSVFQGRRFVTHKTKRQINKTKTRLRSMLHCQYSFGSIVGAPVIFFLGGFVFALVQSLQALGDEDTANGLAFGQWYMVVPHISIISALLLAGNNPNILEGVFATERDEQGDDIGFLGLRFELAYRSCYKVSWQWLRGQNKRQWINKVVETYGIRWDVRYKGDLQVDKDMEELASLVALTPLDWFLLLSLTTLLLGVPIVLAFLTAFYTPEVGLSCRSLTFLIYAIGEFTQLGLWLWAYAGAPPRHQDDDREPRWTDFFRRGGWLDKRGFYQPGSTSWFLGNRKNRTVKSVWKNLMANPVKAIFTLIYCFLAGVFGLVAVTAALGGTLMQLVGVYNSDVCYVTVEYWFRDFKDRPRAVISTNSAEMIKSAKQYWTSCAITAIVFMTVVSFAGWWYQRRMRDMFAELVKRIYLPEDETDNPQLIRANIEVVPASAHSPVPPSLLARSPPLRPAVPAP